MSNTKKTFLHQQLVLAIVVIAGIALLVVGIFGVIDYLRTTTTGETVPAANMTVTDDVDHPSEKKPDTIEAAYSVPAGQPRVVQIPALNVDAYVQRVGVTKGGAMATPNNIFFGGWYVMGVAPGEKGVSIINGHAGGRYEQGIFRGLNALSEGDAVRVQMGDLSWREFSIVSVKTYAVQDSAAPLFEDDPSIDKELHLITCDGVFDDKTQTYDKRTIVVATLNR